MDENLKEQADSLFQQFGLTMTSAVNLFVRHTVTQRKIPFEIVPPVKQPKMVLGVEVPEGEEDDPFYSESNIRALLKSIKSGEEGRVTEHELIEV
jgi:DNA-damage-inducible protein J